MTLEKKEIVIMIKNDGTTNISSIHERIEGAGQILRGIPKGIIGVNLGVLTAVPALLSAATLKHDRNPSPLQEAFFKPLEFAGGIIESAEQDLQAGFGKMFKGLHR